MKVLNVTGSISPNAVEETCDRLCEYFPNHDIENIIFGEFESRTSSVFKEHGMETNFIGKESIQSQFRLIIQILSHRKKTDLIHIYGGQALHTPIPLFISQLTHIPVITRFNRYTNPDKKWKKIIAFALEKYIIHFSDAIIFNSENQLDDTLTKYRISEGKHIFVVPPGVRSDHFSPVYSPRVSKLRDELSISRSDQVIGMVITPRPVKQPKLAIDIFEKVSDSIPDKVHLVIVGDSDHVPEYTKYSGNSHKSQQIHWVGYKPTSELPKWYSLFDVTILTSKSESFGMSITESYLCGTPCVAHDIGGMSDQIINGKTGYLVPLDDQKEFCSKIINILTDDQLKRKFREEGKEYVENQFSLSKAGEKYSMITDTVTNN